jgi:diguanylate cyclase
MQTPKKTWHADDARAALKTAVPGTDPGAWDALLGAVRARLREALAAWPESAPAALVDGSAEEARAIGYNCVEALDQLHDALVAQAQHSRRLELEISEARAALREACTQLLGTQAEERRVRHLALHDSLTQLPNRGCFCTRLDQLLATTYPQRPALALLYLDLDGFKLVNDTHGHEIGDELLRVVAARLLRAVRADDMVSRLGGDEFACLLVGMSDRRQLSRLARKLLDAVSAPLKVGELTLQVHASIGIALCPEDGTTTQALLRTADEAMYRAKRQQTGLAFFDEAGALRSVTARPGARLSG